MQNAVSENERLQFGLHPWTSFLIVPIFALANAGVTLSSELLEDAVTSPVTIGIICALVFGKLFGIGLDHAGRGAPTAGPASAPGRDPAGLRRGGALRDRLHALTVHRRDRFRGQNARRGKGRHPRGGGDLDGARRRDHRDHQSHDRERAHQLRHAVGAARRPRRRRSISSATTSAAPRARAVTLLEYGDYECIYCGRAEDTVRELLERFDDELTYVWRHLPLQDVHPRAQLASEAAEAAAAQGKFWEMHDLMIDHQHDIEIRDLRRLRRSRSASIVDRFWEDLRSRDFAERVAEDVESADESLVTGTPSFFINGRRHEGAYDIDTLTEKVRKILGAARSAGLALHQQLLLCDGVFLVGQRAALVQLCSVARVRRGPRSARLDRDFSGLVVAAAEARHLGLARLLLDEAGGAAPLLLRPSRQRRRSRPARRPGTRGA